MLSIGELSQRSGVKIPTIRFYETKGLMPEPERSEGNQRRYDRAALERLLFIRHSRDLGLPLADVAALISLEGASGEALNAAHEIAHRQRDAVRDRIARLRLLERELDRIANACESHHGDGHGDHVCAVLHAFAEPE
ncbi:MerR family transcriptional regulator [Albibacillus kandeliae]|uniref:MerR family transcriptional regulator n=1 Tax=Albibacillus kandeliae TaxID=2174228 RepID=UPI000D697229|nr:MerR family transcriptional regulator [Albibacillus kandeliae]